ncbi:hypothetical protein BOTNAR_0269g00070 [Botryotinia narcissicola]|uniref:Uncharacterized protein n=1 Tax=Botryotinia narcissicola TaxID=278944 RepID=A0A4Z1HZ81_9HELO|nr:hypothetical protein BOTNAR_0269g00070 [Botryotinia narcissicola]
MEGAKGQSSKFRKALDRLPSVVRDAVDSNSINTETTKTEIQYGKFTSIHLMNTDQNDGNIEASNTASQLAPLFLPAEL